MLAIIKGKSRAPQRDVVKGPPGAGKSTFACGGPNVLALSYEDGLNHIGAPRVDCKGLTWEQSLATIKEACVTNGDWRTVVIDTIDRLEAQLITSVCLKGKKESLEDFGYGKGQEVVGQRWRELLFLLESAREHGRHIILVSHQARQTVKDPTLGDYHVYTGAITKQAWGSTFQWADNVLHATHEAGVKDGRQYMTGARVLRTVSGSGYDAKNRLGLPPEMPLDWSAYARYLRAPDEVRAAISGLTNGDAEVTAKAASYVLQAGDDVSKLCGIESALINKSKGAGT